MKVHLIDGTYELFRHYYALPKQRNKKGEEIAAARGVVNSMLSLLSEGATHVAIATDYVIESFRNGLWDDYKDGSGIDPDLYSQFRLLEEGVAALGIRVWPMIEYEADDALAGGAAMASKDKRVEQVLICTPDKDLAQCVVDNRIVQFDRRQRNLINREGVIKKFGVPPESIPDYLALTGDSADGYPGLPGWGAKSASAVLARYGHLENIPAKARDWRIAVRGADRLAAILSEQRELALLFRRLATLVVEGVIKEQVDDLIWKAPEADFPVVCERLVAPEFPNRANALAERRRRIEHGDTATRS
jgi:5'-3' exonuclease